MGPWVRGYGENIVLETVSRALFGLLCAGGPLGGPLVCGSGGGLSEKGPMWLTPGSHTGAGLKGEPCWEKWVTEGGPWGLLAHPLLSVLVLFSKSRYCVSSYPRFLLPWQTVLSTLKQK